MYILEAKLAAATDIEVVGAGAGGGAAAAWKRQTGVHTIGFNDETRYTWSCS